MIKDELKEAMMKRAWWGEFSSYDITVDDAVEVAMEFITEAIADNEQNL